MKIGICLEQTLRDSRKQWLHHAQSMDTGACSRISGLPEMHPKIMRSLSESAVSICYSIVHRLTKKMPIRSPYILRRRFGKG
jgi:hypothetical protein